MATAKPRISITLETDEYEFLKVFAEKQHESMGSCVLAIWRQATPVLTRVLKLIVEAERAKESVAEGIREASEEAIRQIQPQHAQAMLNFELFEEAVRQEIVANAAAKEGTPPRGERRLPPPQPPRSNTGVRSTKNVKNQRGVRGG